MAEEARSPDPWPSRRGVLRFEAGTVAGQVELRVRYQGSDIFVHTERKWARKQYDRTDNRFPDPIAEKILDQPAQLAVCRELGLEDLTSDEVVIILSKPGFGPPLYWPDSVPESGHLLTACLLSPGAMTASIPR